jgi:hypothetical protein
MTFTFLPKSDAATRTSAFGSSDLAREPQVKPAVNEHMTKKPQFRKTQQYRPFEPIFAAPIK